VLNYHRFMGFYYTPSWMALLDMRDLVRGPRTEQNHPTQTESRQHDSQDLGGCSIDDSAHGPWFHVSMSRR